MANRISLASAIRSSAFQVSGEAGKLSGGFNIDRNYANSRVGSSVGPTAKRS